MNERRRDLELELSAALAANRVLRATAQAAKDELERARAECALTPDDAEFVKNAGARLRRRIDELETENAELRDVLHELRTALGVP